MQKFHYRNRSAWFIYAAIACVLAVSLFLLWQYKGYLVRMTGWPFLPDVPPAADGITRFAVIGDYGEDTLQQRDVARLIKSWHPEFITTTGDNNYPEGSAETIDPNIGKNFSDYIHPYKGVYGSGAERNRFFPIPGHRDWDTENLKPYLDYFTLAGNERYYDFTWGPVHCFMLDTDEREPDGATVHSRQAMWLKEKLAASNAPWKLVFAHHAPFTSHAVEDIERMRWPFKAWGAHAVLSGYYHVYERLLVDGIPYFINGAGGSFVSGYGEIDSHSQFRYNEDYGAMMVETGDDHITFMFINRIGETIDLLTVNK